MSEAREGARAAATALALASPAKAAELGARMRNILTPWLMLLEATEVRGEEHEDARASFDELREISDGLCPRHRAASSEA